VRFNVDRTVFFYQMVAKRTIMTRMMKQVLLSALLPLLLMAVSCSREPSKAELTIMSYNIGYGQFGIENIAETIRSANPDIVALQEVDVMWSERSDFMDQATHLAEALEMELFYAPIYEFPDTLNDGGSRRFGLAFLSRIPIQYAINHSISRLSTQDTLNQMKLMPGFPEIRIQIGNQLVGIYNTHLDFRRDPRVRQQQISEMLSVMESYDGPTILLGDFNAMPDSDELKPIFDRLTNATAAESLPLYTFPADSATRQIDYITYSGHFTLQSVFVVASRASDHLPIIARLTINPK
jgi:endonuclease/exonuclease/phosphatase family metal-dependent hydrolase